jgi:hypothetical protein
MIDFLAQSLKMKILHENIQKKKKSSRLKINQDTGARLKVFFLNIGKNKKEN